MAIDREQVAKIASLARIRMSEDELDRIAPEFSKIIDWVEQLGEVDTSAVEPMTAVIPQALRLRDDVVDADPLTAGGRREDEVNADPKTGGDRREDILANAPAAEHGFFGVPKVIE